ncbi:MAG: diaminopimelate epimerase [Candidatus Paceibacterota bacterium]|jgi:diaminopimelate epimerase
MTKFYKYHGAGNDFIMIDNRDKHFDVKDIEKIKFLCHRHFGIGADGIQIVQSHPNYDFEMIFVNSDGSIGSMCGNGGRCIVHFAHYVLKMIKDPKHVKFIGPDGEHEAEIIGDIIKLKMRDMENVHTRNNLPFVCCGTTPHNIKFVENLEKYGVVEEGKKLRYSDPDGVNANFVEIKNGIFNVRTYERGVEDETMACGTAATSVAIISHHLGILKENICHIKTLGGDLTVEFEKVGENKYQNIWLTGPAKFVFEGEIK